MSFFHKNIITSKQMLHNALKEHYAVGAFNFSNMEMLQAIVEAHNELARPAIIQVSESALKYMGMPYLIGLVSAAAETAKFPLCLHLDHGQSFDICKECIDAGFSSVMIDKSSAPFEENIEETKKVTAYAHARGVSVEAELGTLAGIEDLINVSRETSVLTVPGAAEEFVAKTGADSLAVAIGTSHGINKGKTNNPKLDIERLQSIRNLLGEDYPLVLHGASAVYPDIVEKCNSLGMDLKNAFGISDEDIKIAVKHGIAKINIDTDLRLAFLEGVLDYIKDFRTNIDPRKYLNKGKEEVKNVIKRRVNSFKAS